MAPCWHGPGGVVRSSQRPSGKAIPPESRVIGTAPHPRWSRIAGEKLHPGISNLSSRRELFQSFEIGKQVGGVLFRKGLEQSFGHKRTTDEVGAANIPAGDATIFTVRNS